MLYVRARLHAVLEQVCDSLVLLERCISVDFCLPSPTLIDLLYLCDWTDDQE